MKSKNTRKKLLKLLKKENDRALIEHIRAQLELPMNKRTHFLRRRLAFGGSSL